MIHLDSVQASGTSPVDADSGVEPLDLVRTSTRHGGVGPPVQRSVFAKDSPNGSPNGLPKGLPNGSPSATRAASLFNDRRPAALLAQVCATLDHEIDNRVRLEQEMAILRTTLEQAGDALLRTEAREKEARHLANHDALTSLANRGCFNQRLHAALGENAAPLAVVYLDLDHFKAVNDDHGHQAGDDLLIIVAARLSHVVRSEDLLSRLGGDEFACLLTGALTRDQLQRFALKLYDALASPCQIGRLSIQVRPSIGIAVCPEDAVSAQALLKKADAAMFAAKRARSRFAFFATGM